MHVKSARLRRFTSPWPEPGRAPGGFCPVLYSPGATMKQVEFQEYHQREAARLRRLIANATTPAIKSRLMEQAEEHERLAEGGEIADTELVDEQT